MLYGSFGDEALVEMTTLELSRRDILLIEEALRFLLESSTRHEHMFHDIHDLLDRLEEYREATAA